MRIAHRVNFLDKDIADHIFTIADGIEFDIRDNCGEIIVEHDPYKDGQNFKDFISFCYPDKFYIMNVKCEGIEDRAIKLMDDHKCHNFFLLDCSIPMIVKLGKKGETRIATRFSEYECFDSIKNISPFISWVWIDVFTKLPITKDIYTKITELNLKCCLVSPELQGQPEKIETYKEELTSENITIDCVCTKETYLPHWNHFFVSSLCPNE